MRHQLAAVAVLYQYVGLLGLVQVAAQLARYRGWRGWLHAAYPELRGAR